MNLKITLQMQVGPGKSANWCLVGWDRSWWYTLSQALQAVVP